MLLRALALCLMLCAAALGQTPKKAVPLNVTGDTVVVVRKFPVTVTAPAGAHVYTWLYPSTLTAKKSGNTLTVTAGPKGSHRISVSAITVDFDKKVVLEDTGETTLTVGDVPPGPDPGPNPPGPDPKPPQPVGDLRVLIVFERADLAKYSREVQRILTGDKVADTLRAKCGKDDFTGDGKAYNIWDKDTQAKDAPKFWRDALARPRAGVPWIHIFRGDTPVVEKTLPETEAAVIQLINDNAPKE